MFGAGWSKMAKAGKRLKEALKQFEQEKLYDIQNAVNITLKMPACKFDETLQCAVRLGVDSKKQDQNVRGTVVLPHGTGKHVRVAVFAQGEKIKEAEEAGAEHVGGADLIEKVSKGFLDFDQALATPDIMGQVSKLGKILGPRGMMPNPKVGTVTFDIAKAVKEVKAGKVEFKLDKQGNVHVPFGKRSFGEEKLVDNFKSLMTAILRAKPASSKGAFLRSVTIHADMSPGVKIDTRDVQGLSGKA